MDERMWVGAILGLIGLFFAGAIIWGVVRAKQEKVRVEKAIAKARRRKNFNADDIYVSRQDPNGFAIDTKSNTVLLITKTKQKKVKFENLVSVEIVQDGATITSTSRGSQVAGAVVGGVLLGGVGAIIGGLSGSKTSSEGVRKISLRLVTDDFNAPNHEVVFLDWSHTKKGLPADHALIKETLSNANKWHSRFSTVIKRIDAERNASALKEEMRPVAGKEALPNPENINEPPPQLAPPNRSMADAAQNVEMAADEKECPRCAEIIKRRAKYCRYCSYEYSEEEFAAEQILFAKEEGIKIEAEKERRETEKGINYQGYQIIKNSDSSYEILELGIKLKGSEIYESIQSAKSYIDRISG